MDIGERVYVKHQEATPYSGIRGTVGSIDKGYNFPIEVKLDDVTETCFYTERELRVIVGTERKK
jgi:hypothetical protein